MDRTRPFKAGPETQAAALAIGLWLIAFAFYCAPDVALGVASMKRAAFLLACAVFGAAQCWGLFLLLRRAMRFSHRRRVAVMLAATCAATLLHGLIDTLGYSLLYPKVIGFPASAHLTPTAYLFLVNTLLLSAAYAIYVAGVGLMLAAFEIQAREASLAAAREAAQEAQLTALRFQINPHFLFNALNAVTALIGSHRNAEANIVVSRLAEFFRASLDTAPGALVRIEDELDVAASYLDIESARFGPRLEVEIECPPSLREALTPHFLLQPLVENAVKHGVARSRRPVTISIAVQARDGALVLSVADDARVAALHAEPQAAPRGPGVGLANVAARLEALFGAKAGLRTIPSPSGFTAEVTLPLVLHDSARAA